MVVDFSSSPPLLAWVDEMKAVEQEGWGGGEGRENLIGVNVTDIEGSIAPEVEE